MDRLVWFLLIGLAAGWCAGLVMKGRGFGMFGDIVVGVLGAVIGGWLFSLLGLTAYGTTGALVIAFIGAVTLLALISVVKRV
ncbi:MAG: GlsB/YeaQ/YmgE family stress response membrane protein [Candidatus Omnitrophica bacterium]|nr:GlsB/YeaQ/YmgE family stress response membrane protein [Candidatus Omnitrophota bacterium]